MKHPSRILAALALAAAMALPGLQAQQKPPQPKSQKELEALQAVQNATTADARLKAIDNVLTSFADTEFKLMLLQMAMQTAESKNDYAATKLYAERVLEADPKNVFAEVTLASEMTRHTREFDLDKTEKLTQAEKYAKAAIDNMPTAPKIRPDMTDEQWNTIRKDLTAQAHVALGAMAMLRNQYDVAITELKTAQDTAHAPDAATAVRLGEAYTRAGKYDDAIAAFTQAETLPDASAQVKQIAATRKADVTKMKASGVKPSNGAAGGPAQVEIKH